MYIKITLSVQFPISCVTTDYPSRYGCPERAINPVSAPPLGVITFRP